VTEPLRTSTSDTGVPVVTKVRTGELAPRLRREAELLTKARHPGVVELIAISDDGERVELQLGHVVGRNLLDQPPLEALQIAAVMAEVANTLTDLHGTGIVHSNIGAEHIIVDRHHHVTICGFGSAESSAEAEPDSDLDPALDVIAVGRVLDHELSRSLGDNTISDRDPIVIGLRHISDLADFASVDGRDVSMSDIAFRLNQLAGNSTADAGRSASTGSADSLFDRLREGLEGSRHVAVGVAVAVLTLSSAWLLQSNIRGSESSIDLTAFEQRRPELTAGFVLSVPPPPDSSADPALTSPPTLLRPAVAPECPAWDRDAEWADVNGDGCEEPWWRIGAVLAVGNDRYTLGTPDDLVVLGDWNCDGTATPALVEQLTGSVFLFEEWARDGGTARVTETRRVTGAVAATATRIARCDVLTIETADGVITVNGADT